MGFLSVHVALSWVSSPGSEDRGETLPAEKGDSAEERSGGEAGWSRGRGWTGGSETHEAVQWQRLHTRNAEGPGSIPGQGTAVLMPPGSRPGSRSSRSAPGTWHRSHERLLPASLEEAAQSWTQTVRTRQLWGTWLLPGLLRPQREEDGFWWEGRRPGTGLAHGRHCRGAFLPLQNPPFA